MLAQSLGQTKSLHYHFSNLRKPLHDICVQSLVLLRVRRIVETVAAKFSFDSIKPYRKYQGY